LPLAEDGRRRILSGWFCAHFVRVMLLQKPTAAPEKQSFAFRQAPELRMNGIL
jgi:hypothetical protein